MRVTLTAGWIARHTPATRRPADAMPRSSTSRKTSFCATCTSEGRSMASSSRAERRGRFSTDLDFSLAGVADDPDDVVLELIAAIDGTAVGPFTYAVRERRGKWSLIVESPFNDDEADLTSKLDVSPAAWMSPVRRGWVPMSVHATYGEPPLPKLQTIRVEENLAEKISRLNRTTTARDMYDLAWIAAHRLEIGGIARDRVRRLAILKTWVDANGVSAGNAVWKPSHDPAPFDPDRWLRQRNSSEFDLGDIGALAVPTPSTTELSEAARTSYRLLADLADEARQLAAARGQDRPLALKLRAELPDGLLSGARPY
jgi:hypothetical protein